MNRSGRVWIVALVLWGVGLAREAILYECATPGLKFQYVFFDSSDTELSGAVMGAGKTGVVLSNDSHNVACKWLDFARALAEAGFQVLMYEYGTPQREADTAAAVAALRQRGAERIVLVGASQGAKTSIIVASRNLPGVVALVSLSAEETMAAQDIKPFAARLELPVLFVTAQQDAFQANLATPIFYRLAPSKNKQLAVMPGSAHGTQLLKDPRLAGRVLDFIRAYR